jgi:hypothetical protein
MGSDAREANAIVQMINTFQMGSFCPCGHDETAKEMLCVKSRKYLTREKKGKSSMEC